MPATDSPFSSRRYKLAQAAGARPFLFELPQIDGPKALDDLESGTIAKPDVDDEWVTVEGAIGTANVRIVKPKGATCALPVVPPNQWGRLGIRVRDGPRWP